MINAEELVRLAAEKRAEEQTAEQAQPASVVKELPARQYPLAGVRQTHPLEK